MNWPFVRRSRFETEQIERCDAQITLLKHAAALDFETRLIEDKEVKGAVVWLIRDEANPIELIGYGAGKWVADRLAGLRGD